MTTLLYILAQTGATGGAVAGGTGVLGLTAWFIKRHIRRRDERNKMLNDKLDAIMEEQAKVAVGLAVATTKLEAGDGRFGALEARFDRIEAGVDDLRRDMKTVKRRATDKQGDGK
jgi:hypothetical protein